MLFQVFFRFQVSPASRLDKPHLGFESSYCIISTCNELFFEVSTPQISEFSTKLAIFNFFLTFFASLLSLLSVYLSLMSYIQVFQPNRKSPLGFVNELLKNVCWPWISYNHLSQILAVFLQLLIFFKFFVIFVTFLCFFSPRCQKISSRVLYKVTA